MLQTNFTFFSSSIRISRKNINFEGKKIKTSDFYKFDDNKILVSSEETYGTKNSFKYFIGYNNNDFIRPLCINFWQTNGYVRPFEGNITICFKISDK